MPRDEDKDEGFWIGPLSNLKDTEQVAEDMARYYDYIVRHCKTCFPEKRMPSPYP